MPSLLWEVIAGVPANARRCPAVPFNTAPALERFLPSISSTGCFPIHRAALRLVPGRALPSLQRERQLRSSAFTNQTDNLSLRCFSRKSKNYSFFQSDWCLVTSWWEVIAGVPANARRCPAVPFNTAPALERFLPNISSTGCFRPQSLAKTGTW